MGFEPSGWGEFSSRGDCKWWEAWRGGRVGFRGPKLCNQGEQDTWAGQACRLFIGELYFLYTKEVDWMAIRELPVKSNECPLI
jgi:hypothetical protein